MKDKKNKIQTRLIEVAMQLFAKKSFQETRISDICKLAGTNLASINYYFRTKEDFYVKTWEYANKLTLEHYPIEGWLEENAPIRERFQSFIRSLILRKVDRKNAAGDIFLWELKTPTGLLNDEINNQVIKISQVIQGFVREIVGEKVSKEIIELCCVSILSLSLSSALRLRETAIPQEHTLIYHAFIITSSNISVETEINHVVDVTWAMLKKYSEVNKS